MGEKIFMQPNYALHKFVRIILISAFWVYLYLLVYLTVFKRLSNETISMSTVENYRLGASFYFNNSVNLIPFKTIFAYINHPPNAKTALINIGGNILAFLPLGILVPAILKGLRNYRKILLTALGASLSIEIIQMLLRIGSSDIDDIILNILGGLLGYAVFYLVLKVLRGNLVGGN